MTVFKGYMKIIGQNRMLILLYVAIFFGCTLLFQSTAGKSETSYQAEKLNIGIVDEDGGSLAESLTEYLGNRFIKSFLKLIQIIANTAISYN